MKKILVHPSSTGHWLDLVHDAQRSSQIKLQEELESYLVFLLMRFMGQPELVASVLGLEFLCSANSIGASRDRQLKEVGDKCLLISGLFPGRAERKRVRLSYFIRLGKSAYLNISATESASASLFSELSYAFVNLRDVLQAIRTLSPDEQGLDIWQALDLWEDTGSTLAKDTLQKLSPNLLAAKTILPKNEH